MGVGRRHQWVADRNGGGREIFPYILTQVWKPFNDDEAYCVAYILNDTS